MKCNSKALPAPKGAQGQTLSRTMIDKVRGEMIRKIEGILIKGSDFI
jgi:hypothetical protein